MVDLIFLGIACLGFSFFTGFLFAKKNFLSSFAALAMTTFWLFIFSITLGGYLEDDFPATDIPVGIYNVALVSVDSHNEEIIYVGLYNRTNDKKEEKINSLSLYQFPTEMFGKRSRGDADTLVVTKSKEGHKKINLLRLK